MAPRLFRLVETYEEDLPSREDFEDFLATLLPPTVHGKKFWLFRKIGIFTRQINALKRRNEELKDKLKGYESRLSKSQTATWGLCGIRRSVSLLVTSAKRRVRDDHIGCIHIGSDGYCNRWYWRQRQLDRDQKAETALEDGVPRQVWRDNVKMSPEICASCPTYSQRSID